MSDFLATKVFTVLDISIPLVVFGGLCYFYVKWPDFFSQLVELTLLLYKSSSPTEDKKVFILRFLILEPTNFSCIFSLPAKSSGNYIAASSSRCPLALTTQQMNVCSIAASKRPNIQQLSPRTTWCLEISASWCLPWLSSSATSSPVVGHSTNPEKPSAARTAAKNQDAEFHWKTHSSL